MGRDDYLGDQNAKKAGHKFRDQVKLDSFPRCFVLRSTSLDPSGSVQIRAALIESVWTAPALQRGPNLAAKSTEPTNTPSTMTSNPRCFKKNLTGCPTFPQGIPRHPWRALGYYQFPAPSFNHGEHSRQNTGLH